MKAKEVLKLLKVTRPTLCKYVADGRLTATKQHNGFYDYNEKSVYALLNKNIPRKTVVYSRVSTSKQKADLRNQTEMLKHHCFMNGYTVAGIYEDVASGISFSKRNGFFEMLDEILDSRVERVVISYKDRLSRVGFELFATLFEKFNCKIEVMSEVGSAKLDSQDIFEEIVALLHCYSMKLYSSRRQKKVKELCKPE